MWAYFGNYIAVIWVGLMFYVFMLWLKRCWLKEHRRITRVHIREGRQENDVWNISGRVHNHEQWPTHDHHISIDSYVFPSESKDPRLAPPAYSEVGLPTYEEAINASNHHKTTTLPAPVHTVVQVPRENS